MDSNAETTICNHARRSRDENTSSDKKNNHRIIEEKRRIVERKHFEELHSLIPDWYGTQSSKLTQLVSLEMAADLLDQIDLRYQNDPLLPSYLTANEAHFLNLEASNTFLFVTTIEPTGFRVIYVTDSIRRVLHIAPEEWYERNLLQLIHPDDFSQVFTQLSSISQYIDNKPSFKCRMQQGHHSYSSVIINGMMKKIDQSLKPISANEDGFFAFIGICQIPLIDEYREKNMRLHQNPDSLVFACRCSLNDWKIFLVDCSVSTFPSISSDFFREKSILEFIRVDDRTYVHQHLVNSTLTNKDEFLTCHFVYSSTEIFFMTLQIKPLFNTSTKHIEFVELLFEHILTLAEETN